MRRLGQEGDQAEKERGRIKAKLARLKLLCIDEGDLTEREYRQRKAELQAQLDALRMPRQPEIQEAGEALEKLGATWVGASKRLRRDMLRVIFEGVYFDTLTGRLVCVKPYPQFGPLFRMDGLKEKEGCFYVREEEQETGPTD